MTATPTPMPPLGDDDGDEDRAEDAEVPAVTESEREYMRRAVESEQERLAGKFDAALGTDASGRESARRAMLSSLIADNALGGKRLARAALGAVVWGGISIVLGVQLTLLRAYVLYKCAGYLSPGTLDLPLALGVCIAGYLLFVPLGYSRVRFDRDIGVERAFYEGRYWPAVYTELVRAAMEIARMLVVLLGAYVLAGALGR